MRYDDRDQDVWRSRDKSMYRVMVGGSLLARKPQEDKDVRV
jgi:hypothetical protein